MRIALVAGEASGDLLGAGLIAELRKRYPQPQFAGIGGDAMRAAGLDAWFDASELAVMGLPKYSPPAAPAAAASRAARTPAGVEAGRVHRHRRARLQPRRGEVAQAARHPHRALRQSVGLGLAREARGEDRPQCRPRAVPVSDGTADLREARHRCALRRPSARGRDAAGSRSRRACARSSDSIRTRAGAGAAAGRRAWAKSSASARSSWLRRRACSPRIPDLQVRGADPRTRRQCGVPARARRASGYDALRPALRVLVGNARTR